MGSRGDATRKRSSFDYITSSERTGTVTECLVDAETSHLLAMSDHLLSLLRAGGVGAIAAPPQPRPASHSPPPAPAANSNDSIDSLIARMTMAGGPQQPAQSGISSAQGRQNQLLGLLGGPTSPPPVLDQMSLHQRVISPPPAHAPSHGPAGGNGLMAQNLLDSLMGRTTPAHNAPAASNAEAHPLREPVVQHQSPAQHPPAPPAHRQPSFPAAPAPEAPQTVTPAKGTKFDFISPFDVFDEPPKPSSAKKPAASAQASLPIDAPHSPAKKAKKPKQPEMSAPSASTITPSMSISQRKSPVGADRAVSQTGGKRKADEIKLLGSARSFAKPDPALLPLVLKNIGYTLDLRTTDPVGIVADENAIEERKISITKTDTMTAGLTFGQTISASEAIVAYVMSKGRVRVLRQDDGVNELVTLTKADGMPETIKDIDVTDQYVAVLTESGTLALYEIEQRADDTMALRQISRSDRGSSFTHALPKKVRLSTRDAEHVYVMDTSAVYSIEISTLAENPDKNWIDLSGTTYRLPEDMGELGSSKPVDFDISKRHAILGVVGEDGAYAVFKLGDATPTAKGQIVGGLASSIVVMYPSIVIGFERGQSYATLMVSEDGKSGSVCTLNLKTGDVADLPKGALVTLATEGNEPCTLWIANYFRSSILSVSIGRRSGKFLRAIEFPLEAVGHVAIHKATSDDRSWSFFYKHAKGFSQALVQDSSKYANMLLVDEDPEDVPPETRPDGINAHFAETMPQTTINADEEMQSDPREEPQVAPAADDSQLARFETVLQREIRLLGKNQVTQLEKLKLASQVEEIERQQTLVRLVSDALDNDVKTHLQRVVQDEIKAQLIPSAEAIVKKAIQDATGPKLAERINKGIESVSISDQASTIRSLKLTFNQTVLAQVEKVLLPRLEESLNKSLEPIVSLKDAEICPAPDSPPCRSSGRSSL